MVQKCNKRETYYHCATDANLVFSATFCSISTYSRFSAVFYTSHIFLLVLVIRSLGCLIGIWFDMPLVFPHWFREARYELCVKCKRLKELGKENTNYDLEYCDNECENLGEDPANITIVDAIPEGGGKA